MLRLPLFLLFPLLLAAGCHPESKLTLHASPASCALGGAVDHLVVTALGDLAPAPSLTRTFAPQDQLTLGALDASVHVVTLEAFDASGARVGVGQTAPFTFGKVVDGPIAIAFGGPDLSCAVAALRAPRWGHRATLTADGLVLYTGGRDAGGPVTLVERYDPPSAAFYAEGQLPGDSAIGHSATLLDDGTVLIAGGARADGTGNSATIRLSSDGLVSAPTTGALGAGRAFHAAVRLAGGLVMVSGGCGRVDGDGCAPGTLRSGTEVYDPAHGTWHDGPALVRARSHHEALLLGDGRVLILGGRVDGGAADDAEVVDLQSSQATRTAVPAGAVATLDTGTAIIAGGELRASTDVRALAAPTEEPISIGALGVARSLPTVTRFGDGDLLVLGGTDGGGHASGAADLVSALGRVGALGATSPRSDHTATQLGDGSILVAGGRDESGAARADGQLWIHSITGPYSNLPSQSFADADSSEVVARRPDRAHVAGGRLVLASTGPGPGEGGRPDQVALLRAMTIPAPEIDVSAGRGAGGAGVAVIVGWLGEADYRFVAFVPGQPVQLFRVAPKSPSGTAVIADAHCAGQALTEGELPSSDVAPLKVSTVGGDLRAYAGSVRVLDCTPTDPFPRGMVGVGSLGGEAIFDDLTATRH